MGEKHPLPEVALDDRLAFVGTSGSGKTYAAGTAVERLLSSGARVVIVDPLDVWYGLRLKPNGKDEAFPVVIFGGMRGDLPITEQSGAVIGETVASMAESCIVSIDHLPSAAARRRFMLTFLDRLYHRATGEPFHLIVDEADMFAPQKASEPMLQSLMEQIVRRGRVKGFIPWLITQRPAVLSKDVLSQADGLIAMKLTLKHDRAAIAGWVETTADPGQWRSIDQKLPTLKSGDAFIWIPARDVLKQGSFPAKMTFDSSRTPKRGEVVRTAALKPVNLDAVKAKLAAIEGEKSKPKTSPAKAVVSAHQAVMPAERALREAEDRGRRLGFDDGKRVGQAEGYRQAQKEAQAALAALKPSEATLITLPARPSPAPAAAPRAAPSAGPGEPLPSGERLCLMACAQRTNGATRQQVTIDTGYKRATRDAYILRLKGRGYVDQNADRVIATDAGIAALGGDYAPLPTGDALRSVVLSRLPEGERKVLEALIAAYPEAVARDAIDAETGYKRATRDAYILRLRVRELVETSGAGYVKASDDLFSVAA